MPSSPTGFHVRHDLQPDLTCELITLLAASQAVITEEELHEAADQRAYRLRERKDFGKLTRSLYELGIVDISRSGLQLSPLGRSIANIRVYYPHLLQDFIHFLYYTSWSMDENKRFSWSYQTVCNFLWNSAPFVINRDRLVNVVIEEASTEFGVNNISFSTSSVAGILNWLCELRPSCIDWQDREQVFIRRSFCSVELFVLALNHSYQAHKVPDLPYIPLSQEIRDQVSQICLIESEAFDAMLDLALSNFHSLQIRRERGERFAILDFSWSNLEE